MKTVNSTDKTKYVLGFMFTEDLATVALIRKKRPVWQAGKLNGIGGHIEPGETAPAAMVREFKEETGYDTTVGGWERFAQLKGEDFEVDVFWSCGELTQLKTQTDELIECHQVKLIDPFRRDVVENLCWLIPLAVDSMDDARPEFTTADYGTCHSNARKL